MKSILLAGLQGWPKMFANIGDVMSMMFSGFWPSVVWAFTIALGFIAPAWPPFAGLCVLVFIDMRTGRKAARKRGETINSKGMRRSVEKTSSYFYLLVAAYVMDQIFLKNVPFLDGFVKEPLLWAAAILCSGVEFKSISENVQEVTGVNVWTNLKERILPTKNKRGEE